MKKTDIIDYIENYQYVKDVVRPVLTHPDLSYDWIRRDPNKKVYVTSEGKSFDFATDCTEPNFDEGWILKEKTDTRYVYTFTDGDDINRYTKLLQTILGPSLTKVIPQSIDDADVATISRIVQTAKESDVVLIISESDEPLRSNETRLCYLHTRSRFKPERTAHLKYISGVKDIHKLAEYYNKLNKSYSTEENLETLNVPLMANGDKPDFIGKTSLLARKVYDNFIAGYKTKSVGLLQLKSASACNGISVAKHLSEQEANRGLEYEYGIMMGIVKNWDYSLLHLSEIKNKYHDFNKTKRDKSVTIH